MRRIAIVEGTAFFVDEHTARYVRHSMTRIRHTLSKRIRISEEDSGTFVVDNVVGSIRLNPQTLLQISPKVDPNVDWASAVLDLIEGDIRFDIVGQRQGGFRRPPFHLSESVASEYASRLQHAIYRDGPLSVLRREENLAPLVKGKLNTRKYLTKALWQPHQFPVSFERISLNNEFAKGLAMVAQKLATVSESLETKSRLLSMASTLRGGPAEEIVVDPSILGREIPTQWSVYRPAWSIATAILSQMSLLRSRGREVGLDVAVEAWPLLERLLTRSLNAAIALGQQANMPWCAGPTSVPLLTDVSSHTTYRSVKPDGHLVNGTQTMATFEAKYSVRNGNSEWPARNHVFQAVTTARACESPLAVLVYPEMFEPTWWKVDGPGTCPKHLVAIGLGLFSYRVGSGDLSLGARILELLQDPRLDHANLLASNQNS